MARSSLAPADVAERIRRLGAGVEADARLYSERWQLMRFANNHIHQPHLETTRSISLRVRVDGRFGTATSTDLSDAGFDRLAASALAIARVAPKEPKFPGFPADGTAPRAVAFSRTTAGFTVERAARLAGAALDAARGEIADARIAGAVNVGTEELAVANTSGLVRFTRRTIATASVLVEQLHRDPPASGWAEGSDWAAERLDTRSMGREAAGRVATSPPRTVRPGKYRVLLRPPAMGELLAFLAHLGFNGHGELEGWSCLKKLRNRKVGPRSLTIVDDGRSASSLPQSIDFEGLAKRRVPLIEEGIARGPVTDLLTAGRLGLESTGHGLPPESPWGDWGPTPGHILMEPGDATESEMIRETRRGLLVTRFHYVRVVHPARSLITGMTRDGTYLIERGEVVAPVRNLRFTESVLGTLSGIELAGRRAERTSAESGFPAITAPAILSRSFRFNSATLF